MKKIYSRKTNCTTIARKLRLEAETLRQLTDTQLRILAGGIIDPSNEIECDTIITKPK